MGRQGFTPKYLMLFSCHGWELLHYSLFHFMGYVETATDLVTYIDLIVGHLAESSYIAKEFSYGPLRIFKEADHKISIECQFRYIFFNSEPSNL